MMQPGIENYRQPGWESLCTPRRSRRVKAMGSRDAYTIFIPHKSIGQTLHAWPTYRLQEVLWR
jgi:hypothetical protein